MGKYESRNPNFHSEILERLKGQHFMHLMGFDLKTIKAGFISGEMHIEQKHNQQFGYVHGGVTATILDICMGFAVYSLLPKGYGTVTANISVDYFKPGQGEVIIAEGEVEKPGKSMMFCIGRVYTIKDGMKTLIATARSVMAVVDATKH